MERPPRACSSASGPPSTSSSSLMLASPLPIRSTPLSSSQRRRLPRAIAPSRRHVPALRAARSVVTSATPSGAPSSGVAATAREVAIDDASAAASLSSPTPATAGNPKEAAAATPPSPPPPSRPLLPPPAVAVALSRELPAAPDVTSAVSALAAAVAAAEREFPAFRSGLVRLEVPLPPRCAAPPPPPSRSPSSSPSPSPPSSPSSSSSSALS